MILKHAGKDATQVFEQIHSFDMIERFLSPNVYMGQVDPEESKTMVESVQETEEDKEVRLARDYMPQLEEVFNSFDFECK